jgi:hypothetical protein
LVSIFFAMIDDLAVADGTGGRGAQRDRLGGGGGLGAPDHGVERDEEDQADGQPGTCSSSKAAPGSQ